METLNPSEKVDSERMDLAISGDQTRSLLALYLSKNEAPGKGWTLPLQTVTYAGQKIPLFSRFFPLREVTNIEKL